MQVITEISNESSMFLESCIEASEKHKTTRNQYLLYKCTLETKENKYNFLTKLPKRACLQVQIKEWASRQSSD